MDNSVKTATAVEVTFEEPEPGAWDAYLKLSAEAKAGIQLRQDHLAGHLANYNQAATETT